MPAAFERCVKSGGRVRTKKLSDGRYIHICFLGGKSYTGEVKTKKEELEDELIRIKGGESDEMKKNETIAFTENLVFSFDESTIDEDKRTVKVCALAPCISRNNRYFSPKVVESASGSLTGKKSFADHDQRDTKNLVGRIVGEDYKDGKLLADIRISKAGGITRQTWEKIKDGTITDVSIAADGKCRRVKMDGKIVDEVSNLDIKSVDFVTEGGVSAAKVMRVFEKVEDIPEITEVKEKMIESVKQLREEYPDFITEVEKPLKDELDTLKKAKEDAEFKLIEKEMAEYKKTKIEKLDINDKVKAILTEKVDGKTKEEIEASIEKETEIAKAYEEAYKVEKKAKVNGVPPAKKNDKDDGDTMTSESIRKDEKIPEDLKGRCIEILWSEGSEAVKTFLKGFKVKA